MFFLCADPAGQRAWFAQHVGVEAKQEGVMFAQLKNEGVRIVGIMDPEGNMKELWEPPAS